MCIFIQSKLTYPISINTIDQKPNYVISFLIITVFKMFFFLLWPNNFFFLEILGSWQQNKYHQFLVLTGSKATSIARSLVGCMPYDTINILVLRHIEVREWYYDRNMEPVNCEKNKKWKQKDTSSSFDTNREQYKNKRTLLKTFITHC